VSAARTFNGEGNGGGTLSKKRKKLQSQLDKPSKKGEKEAPVQAEHHLETGKLGRCLTF